MHQIINFLKQKAKPWINKNIQAHVRERDRLFKHYCNENNPTLKVAKHNKYENAQNVIIFKVKKSKKECYQNYFQNHAKNVNKTWDGIKSVGRFYMKEGQNFQFYHSSSQILIKFCSNVPTNKKQK